VIKKYLFETELKKFDNEELKECLGIRIALSHRIYYVSGKYNPYFMPEENPQDIGFYKASLSWRRKMKLEIDKINNCMEEIFEINNKTTDKLKKYLDSLT